MSSDDRITGVATEGAEEVRANLQIKSCKIHREKQLDVYCADCKKVVCVSCLYESHRSHDWKDVKAVEEEFRQIMGQTATKMKRFVAELSRKKSNLEKKEEFLQKIDLIEKGILEKNKKLKTLLDRHTAILLQSLDSSKSEHLKKMQTDEDELDFRKTVLKSFGRYCDELRLRATAADICRSKDELIQSTEELETEHETFILRPDHSFEISFNPFDIVAILKINNNNIIGEVKGKCSWSYIVAVLYPVMYSDLLLTCSLFKEFIERDRSPSMLV